MKGRALTPEQKRETVERLLAAWLRVPELRLGQFLVAANGGFDLFYREDDALIEKAERLASMYRMEP